MIRIYGNKLTANELAKYLVYDKGNSCECWLETCGIEESDFTEKDIAEVNRHISKHMHRLIKLFKMQPILHKVFK